MPAVPVCDIGSVAARESREWSHGEVSLAEGPEFKWLFLHYAELASALLSLAMLTSSLLCRCTDTGAPDPFIEIYTHKCGARLAKIGK